MSIIYVYNESNMVKSITSFLSSSLTSWLMNNSNFKYTIWTMKWIATWVFTFSRVKVEYVRALQNIVLIICWSDLKIHWKKRYIWKTGFKCPIAELLQPTYFYFGLRLYTNIHQHSQLRILCAFLITRDFECIKE